MVIKFYCGLMFIQTEKDYACYDRYKGEVKCSGSYEKCKTYFDNYVQRIAERD